MFQKIPNIVSKNILKKKSKTKIFLILPNVVVVYGIEAGKNISDNKI